MGHMVHISLWLEHFTTLWVEGGGLVGWISGVGGLDLWGWWAGSLGVVGWISGVSGLVAVGWISGVGVLAAVGWISGVGGLDFWG